MPRIDFYTLEPDSPGDRYLLTCRLVERSRAQSLRVLIHCPDAAAARHLDRLLWTFRQESFIPHGLVGQSDPALTPVLIGLDGSAVNEHQVLINLALETPPFFSRFARICEPVDQDPAVRTAARERFRGYRAAGFPPEHHAVRLTPGNTETW
ncbi:DNA polymerase III subunit chi [uncultured Thiodictyon sp.]|uniref:DNA polymerase III subunit chi n=1 Tax=uncultured Thiodictyon sp. TaxID=1846217 RepID=UPI0025E28B36|nr:DNA polymerase III subunit chi [uncultured Thiodictyon sp.]